MKSYTTRRADIFSNKYSLREDKNEHNRAIKTDREAERSQYQEARTTNYSNYPKYRQDIERTIGQSSAYDRKDNSAENKQNSSRDNTTDQGFRRSIDSREDNEKTIHQTHYANFNDDFKFHISDSDSVRNNQDERFNCDERTSDTNATESTRDAKRDENGNRRDSERQEFKRAEITQYTGNERQYHNDIESKAVTRANRNEERQLSINYQEREISNENIRSIKHSAAKTEIKNGLRDLPKCKLDERKNDRFGDRTFKNLLPKDERNNLRFGREVKHDNDRLRPVQRLSERERGQLEDVYRRIKEVVTRITETVRSSFSRSGGKDSAEQSINATNRDIEATKQSIITTEQAIDHANARKGDSESAIEHTNGNIERSDISINRTIGYIEQADDSLNRTKRDIEKADNTLQKLIDNSEKRSKHDRSSGFDRFF